MNLGGTHSVHSTPSYPGVWDVRTRFGLGSIHYSRKQCSGNPSLPPTLFNLQTTGLTFSKVVTSFPLFMKLISQMILSLTLKKHLGSFYLLLFDMPICFHFIWCISFPRDCLKQDIFLYFGKTDNFPLILSRIILLFTCFFFFLEKDWKYKINKL